MALPTEAEVRAELVNSENNKIQLMKQYSDRMAQLLKENGGSVSDIPVGTDHEYWQVQAKLNLLNKMK